MISGFLSHRHAKRLLTQMIASRLSDDVYRRVYQFPKEVWTLSRMAQCFMVSDGLLKKRLHDEGTSYTRLVIAARMRMAIKFLMEGHRDIMNVYRSTSYFIAVFQKYHGLSPYQYRRKIIPEGSLNAEQVADGE